MGDGESVFIIAEAGINHNGSFKIAKELVNRAKISGADAIKFQTFRAEDIVSKKSPKTEHQKRSKSDSQYEMVKNLELSFDEFNKIKKHCDRKKIEFFSTPYSVESIKFLKGIGVNKFKIASADITNKPLIEEAAKTKKQILLSTGMATLGEIERAINFIKSLNNHNIVILHCNTSYPCPYNEVNMRVLDILKRAFGGPIGYSDHTLGIEIPIMAVSLGAKVIEKHFTLDKEMDGPDHFASLEPREFENMAKMIKNIEDAFGTGIKTIAGEEGKNKFYMRRSLHTSTNIGKNERVTNSHIKIIRPSSGIEPWDIDLIVGKKIKKAKKTDEPIYFEDFFEEI